MKNIHLIPTDKPSKLFRFEDTLIKNNLIGLYDFKEKVYEAHHIYITSYKEIKEEDWFLPKGHINPHKLKGFNKINGDLESYNGLCYDISKCKKIILTTDQDLIKDGVQAIDDEFLEWFVKNPSCESVEIEIKPMFPMYSTFIESIDNPPFYGNLKRKIIIPQEEPKQETLEEVAQWVIDNRYAKSELEKVSDSEMYNTIIDKCAKWQAERMYSEEEVRIAIFTSFLSGVDRGFYSKEIEDKIIQKFKKK